MPDPDPDADRFDPRSLTAPKDNELAIYVDDVLASAIHLAASQRGMSMSRYVRTTMIDAVEDDLDLDLDTFQDRPNR